MTFNSGPNIANISPRMSVGAKLINSARIHSWPEISPCSIYSSLSFSLSLIYISLLFSYLSPNISLVFALISARSDGDICMRANLGHFACPWRGARWRLTTATERIGRHVFFFFSVYGPFSRGVFFAGNDATRRLQRSNNDRSYVTFCRIYRVVCSHRAYRYVSFERKVHCPTISRDVIKQVQTVRKRYTVFFPPWDRQIKFYRRNCARKIATSEAISSFQFYLQPFVFFLFSFSLSLHKV